MTRGVTRKSCMGSVAISQVQRKHLHVEQMPNASVQSKSMRVIADVSFNTPCGLNNLMHAPRCFARSSQCLGIATEAFAHSDAPAIAGKRQTICLSIAQIMK